MKFTAIISGIFSAFFYMSAGHIGTTYDSAGLMSLDNGEMIVKYTAYGLFILSTICVVIGPSNVIPD